MPLSQFALDSCRQGRGARPRQRAEYRRNDRMQPQDATGMEELGQNKSILSSAYRYNALVMKTLSRLLYSV